MLEGVNGKNVNVDFNQTKTQKTGKDNGISNLDIGNLLNGGGSGKLPEKVKQKVINSFNQLQDQSNKFNEALSKLTPEEKAFRENLESLANSKSYTQESLAQVKEWNKQHPDCPIYSQYMDGAGVSVQHSVNTIAALQGTPIESIKGEE